MNVGESIVIRKEIFLINASKVARVCSKSFFLEIQASFSYFLKAVKVCCLDVIDFEKMPAVSSTWHVLSVL